MNIPCVKSCPDRSESCHAECAAYKAWRAERDADAAKRQKKKQTISALAELAGGRYRRRVKKHKEG